MGKGTKRKKNPGVGIDFKRAKHKVGKTLPRGQNDTSVDFRSRAITLPGQSVTEDRSGAAVSSHNLTLKELLAQTGHYSERMRTSGLAGLGDLLQRHPEQVARTAGQLLEALAPRIADAESSVRKALLALLTTQVLPGVGATGVRPFVPLLMAHVCSAMTSLADAVRSDALLFLEALMEVVPGAVASSFLQPVLLHFSDLLSSGKRSASIKSRSLATLHKVVQGLHTFLRKAAGATLTPTSANVVTQQTAPSSRMTQPLAYHRSRWPSATVASTYAAALADLSAGSSSATTSAAADTGQSDSRETVVAQLMSRLLEAWSDCGPSQLLTAPELLATECMGDLVACLSLLLPYLPAATSAELQQSLRTGILKRIAPQLPVSAPAVPPPPTLRAALIGLNLQGARLLGQLLTDAPAGPQQSEAPWINRLAGFYVNVLRDGTALPSQHDVKRQGGQAATRLPREAVSEVLAGIQQMLPHVTDASRAQLLAAVISLAQSSPSKSAVQAACLRLQQRLLAAFTLRTHTGPDTSWAFVSEEDAAKWLQGIPRLLWELGDGDAATSEAALRLLLDAGRTAAPGSSLAASLSALQPQLAPLFATLLPAKKGKDRARFVTGPLARLPTECQALAVDMWGSHEVVQEASMRAVAMVCLSGAYPPELGARAVGVLAAQASRGAVDPAPFHSMLLALLSGSMMGVPSDNRWQRHVTIVSAACAALRSFGSAAHSWRLLEGQLLQGGHPPSAHQRRRYSVLCAATAVADAAAHVAAVQPKGSDGQIASSCLPQATSDALPSLMVSYAAACIRSASDAATSAAAGISLSAGNAAVTEARTAASTAAAGLAAAALPGSASGVQQGTAIDTPGLQPLLQMLQSAPSLLPRLLAVMSDSAASNTPTRLPSEKSHPQPQLQQQPLQAAPCISLSLLSTLLSCQPVHAQLLDAEGQVQHVLQAAGAALDSSASSLKHTEAGAAVQQLWRQVASVVDAFYGRIHR